MFRNRNEAGGFDFDIQFNGSNTEITSDEIIAVWNAHASDAWKAQITLTREGALQTDTLDNLAALDDVPLTGGADSVPTDSSVTEDSDSTAAGVFSLNNAADDAGYTAQGTLEYGGAGDTGAAVTGTGNTREVTYTGTYGTLTVSNDGSWEYTLDNDADVVQALAGGQTHYDSFVITITDVMTDPNNNVAGEYRLVIEVNGADDAPLIGDLAGDPVPVTEAETVILTEAMLPVSDQDAGDNLNGAPLGSFTYTVSNLVNGVIELLGSDGNWAVTTSFTLQQLRDGEVRFAHDGGEQFMTDSDGYATETATPAGFEITIADDENGGGATSAAESITLAVTEVNDAPVLDGGASLAATLDEGDEVTITEAMLKITDVDDARSGITYTLTGLPAHGALRLDGTVLEVGGTFTQQDIADGNLVYEHDGSENFADSFTFTADDGDEDGSAPIANTFALTITAVNDAPVTYLGDGAQASVLFHGVRFTVNEPGTDGNQYKVRIGETTGSDVRVINNTIFISFSYTNAQIDSDEIISLWESDAPSDIKSKINLELVSAESDTRTNLVGQSAVSFSGGTDEGGSEKDYEAQGGAAANPLGDNDVARADINEGGTYVLTALDMGVFDPDDDADAVSYRLTSLPSDDSSTSLSPISTLTVQFQTTAGDDSTWTDIDLASSTVGVNGVFTLAQLAAGRVRVVHNGGEPSATAFELKYRFKDDEVSESAEQTLEISPRPLNDAPTLITIDTARINPDWTAEQLIGTFTTADEETRDQAGFTYQLVNAAQGDARFFTITDRGLSFKTAAQLDALGLKLKVDGETYEFSVQVTDRASDGTADTLKTAQTLTQTITLPVRYFDVDWEPASDTIEGAPTDLEYDLETDNGALAVGSFIIRPTTADARDSYEVELLAGGNDFLSSVTVTPGAKTGGLNGGGRFTIAITPNADNQILKALKEGDTHLESFTMLVRYRAVTADDVEYWSQSTETFTVLFHGQNEAPEVLPTNVVREAAELGSAGAKANGEWHFSDPDSGEEIQAEGILAAHGAGETPVVLALTVSGAGVDPAAEAEVAGDFGSLFIKADGTWEYRADARVERAPLTGASETFRIQVRDTNGLLSSILEIEINIMGVNNAPTFAMNTTPAVAADLASDTDDLSRDLQESTDSHNPTEYGYNIAAETSTRLQAEITYDLATEGEQQTEGRWAAGDVDIGAVTRLFVNSVNLGTTDASRTYEGLFGDLVFNTDGTWVYTIRARAEEIAASETPTDTFAITVQDEYGAASNEIVLTINIAGRNDPPVELIGHTGAVTESGFRVDSRHDFTLQDPADGTADSPVPVASSATPPSDGFVFDGAAASILFHGVRFTAINPGPAGNNLVLNINAGQINHVAFVANRVIAMTFNQNTKTQITSDDIIDLWASARQETKDKIMITLEREGPLQTDTLANLDTPNMPFTGGKEGHVPVSRSDAGTVLATERYQDDDSNDVAGTPSVTGTLDAIDADEIATDGRRDAVDLHTFFIVDADNSNSLQGLDDPDTDAGTNPRDFTSDGETDPLLTDDPTTALKGVYGTLTLNAFTGAWVYHLDNTDPETIALRTASATDSFWIRITDEEGGTLWRQLVVTVNPTDDARIITHADIDDIDVLEAGGTANATTGDTTVSGTVLSDDDDSSSGDVFSVRITDDTDDDASFTNWGTTSVTGKYGTVSLSGSTWTYVLDDSNADVQALDEGDITTETFNLQYRFGGQTDNLKDSNTITIIVTLTGANDAPTLAVTTDATDLTGDVTEDNAATATGSLSFNDVDDEDSNDTLIISTAHAASTGSAVGNHTVPADPTTFSTLSGDPLTVDGTYGTFTFARTDGSGTLVWTYTLDSTAANAALNELHEGQEAYEKLAVRVNDGALDSGIQVITVTITGANDVPDITGVTNGTIADTTNTASNRPTATGDFGVVDIDNGESEGESGGRAPTYAIITGTGGNAATVSGSASEYTITKNSVTWGTIALNTATGAWTFTADADALNSLYNGEQETLSLQARVTDAAGATDTETFTITLTGANDHPVIDVGTGTQASVLYHGVRFTFVEPGTAGNSWQVDILETAGGSRVVTTTSIIQIYFNTGNNRVVSSDEITTLWADSASDDLKAMVTVALEGPSQEAQRSVLHNEDAVRFTGGAASATNEVDDTANTASNTPTATGNFNVTDVDNGEVEGGARPPEYAILSGTGGDAATVSSPTGTAPDLSYTVTKGGVTWGTIDLHTATGAWTFTANADAINALHNGEEEVLSLQARVTDASAATDTETFTITLTGANDDPVIVVSDLPPSVIFHGVKFTAIAPGAEDGDWSINFRQAPQASNVVLVGDNLAVIRFQNTNTQITSQEIIDLWNSRASNTLKNAISLTRVSDETIALGTLTGGNFRTAIALNKPTTTDYDVADTTNTASNTPSVSGDFGVTDLDNGEQEGGSRAPTYAIITGTGGNAATVSGSNITKGGTTWGTIALDTATGVWTFTANAAALNTLHDGEEEILSLQARVTDAAGGTDTETFTITLTGANDNAGYHQCGEQDGQ